MIKLICVLIVLLVTSNASNTTKNGTNSYSYLLVTESNFYLGQDHVQPLEAVFLIGEDYELDSVKSFCSEVIQLYSNEEERKRTFKIEHKDNIGWKTSDELVKELGYSVLLNNCPDFSAFLRLKTGIIQDSLLFINSTYSLVFDDAETTEYHKFYIVKHYW